MCIALFKLSHLLEGSTELQKLVFSNTFQPMCSRYNSQGMYVILLHITVLVDNVTPLNLSDNFHTFILYMDYTVGCCVGVI